jgi:hypothetical protein
MHVPLAHRFENECNDVATEVAQQAQALRAAHNRTRGGQPGSFSYAGRLVVLSIAQGGRVQISGLDQSLDPPQPGEAARESRKMFPGDRAVTVGMNAEGGAIATRAIVAWLTGADEDVEWIRADAAPAH